MLDTALGPSSAGRPGATSDRHARQGATSTTGSCASAHGQAPGVFHPLGLDGGAGPGFVLGRPYTNEGNALVPFGIAAAGPWCSTPSSTPRPGEARRAALEGGPPDSPDLAELARGGPGEFRDAGPGVRRPSSSPTTTTRSPNLPGPRQRLDPPPGGVSSVLHLIVTTESLLECVNRFHKQFSD